MTRRDRAVEEEQQRHPRFSYWVTRGMYPRVIDETTIPGGCTVRLVRRHDGSMVFACDTHEVASVPGFAASAETFTTDGAAGFHAAAVMIAEKPSWWEHLGAARAADVAFAEQELAQALAAQERAIRRVVAARERVTKKKAARNEAVRKGVEVGIPVDYAGPACGLTPNAATQTLRRQRSREEAQVGDAAKD
jgi:hypothetical protein